MYTTKKMISINSVKRVSSMSTISCIMKASSSNTLSSICSMSSITSTDPITNTQTRNINTTSKNSPITQLPLDVDHNTTDYNYIKYLAQNLPELGPYPTYSKYVNPLHFYQNPVMSTWNSKRAHPVSLQQLAHFGKKLTAEKILSSANFVRLEITIRIAKKLREFQVLPFAAISNHHLVRVYESYYNIFETFRKIKPVKTLEANDEFCELLSNMLKDNLLSLPHLTMGALECCIVQSMPQKQLDEFMSSTLRARISRRLICEEHLSVTDKFKDARNNIDKDDYIGDIFYECSSKENLQLCAERISQFLQPSAQCLMPELVIIGNDTKFQFMSPHLRYLFGEILRNSYQSTIAHFLLLNRDKDQQFFQTVKPPPIEVTLIENEDSVGFRFSDRGGGVKGLSMDKIWSFGKNETCARESLRDFHKLPGLQLAADYTPANLGTEVINNDSSSSAEAIDNTLSNTSLAGHFNDKTFSRRNVPNTLEKFIERPSEFSLNLGLAMCKVYAEYWNGRIEMNSMDNFGTDTFLTLQKLGINTSANLDRA